MSELLEATGKRLAALLGAEPAASRRAQPPASRWQRLRA